MQEDEKKLTQGAVGGQNYTEIQAALGRPTQPQGTQEGASTTDYYNALKNESYKALLNSEVQASIARDQALKYTNNALRAKGYGNQGLSESSNLGVYSQYQNALANAANTYRTSVDTINQQQRQEELTKQDDNFKSMTTLMENASNKEELNQIMSNYGYKIKDDGSVDFSNSNLDAESLNQLKVLYSMYNSRLKTTSNEMNSLESINQATYVDHTGKVNTLGSHYVEEMKYLWHKGSNGEYTAGDTFQVKNGNGDTIYMKWTGTGFTLINAEDIDHNGPTHAISWNKSKKSIIDK